MRLTAIAVAEARRSVAGFDKKTIALLLVLSITGGVLLPSVLQGGLALDRGLYRAAVREGSALEPALDATPQFRAFTSADPQGAVRAGLADMGVDGAAVFAAEGPKGQAAVAALARAAKDYAHQRFLEEPDQAAAFPVRVDVRYVAQQAPGPGLGQAPTPSAPPPQPAPPTEVPVVGPGTSPPPTTSPARGPALLPPVESAGTPETLAPPFPFRSLVLAYLFLVPLNFVMQVYGGSVLGERLNRRAEPLLASPARPWELVAGKALPHFLLALGITVAVALAIGAGWLSILAVLPLAVAFMALEFVAAMFARSFRELTFLTVFISVMLTIYAFLPAVFAQVSAVSLVSPISLVVMDLRGQPVGWAQALYATLPLTAFALALFVLGAALMREEDLFHQKPVPAKLLDALARQVTSARSGFKLAVLLIPCVFVAELLVVVGLVAVSAPVAFAGGLLAVALVEETCKGLPSYAAVARGALPRARSVRFGAFAGLGFFAAEKGFLLVALVGLLQVPAGAAVFGGPRGGVLDGLGGPVLLLLAAPLVLHVTTASISGWGARLGKAGFVACFALAVAIHAAYDAALLMGVRP